MKIDDSRLMNILYSPITYIHSDKISEFHSSINILTDVILNYWIIDQYQLENLPDTWLPDDAVSTLLFHHWQMIPKVADLIGGYLLREQLLIEKLSLIRDSRLLAFISLPIRHTVTVSQQSKSADRSVWGIAFIIGLTKNLPIALRQRLRLFFPKDILLPTPYIAITPDHINLLKMAINYAYDS